MRILTVGNMYPPHHLGGYELTWRSSVEQLRAGGHEVAVLTTGFRRDDPDPAFPEDPQVTAGCAGTGTTTSSPGMWLGDRLALERHNKATLAKELDACRPDVVCWWAMGGMSLALIEQVRQAGIPAVGVVGDDWMVYGPRVDGWTRFLRRLRLTGPRLDGVTWLFNSAATRDAAGQTGGRVVHPGVDTALFGAHPPHDWAWRLLYVGRLDPRKGIDAAVEAMATLPRRPPSPSSAPARTPTGRSSAPCARGWAWRTGSRSASGPGMSSRPRTRRPTRCCSPCAGPNPGAWSRWRR